jgi:hypothetical protein
VILLNIFILFAEIRSRIINGPRKKAIRIMVAILLFFFLPIGFIDDSKATEFIRMATDIRARKVCPSHEAVSFPSEPKIMIRMKLIAVSSSTRRFLPTRMPTAFFPADRGSILKKS